MAAVEIPASGGGGATTLKAPRFDVPG